MLHTYIYIYDISRLRVKRLKKEGISKDHHIHCAWRGGLKSHTTGTEVCISLANEDNVFLLLVDYITESRK